MRVLKGRHAVIGAAPLLCAAALAGCGRGRGAADGSPLDTARWSGVYVSDTLPGAVRPRLVRLTVGPDTISMYSIEFLGLGVTYHPGRWTARGDQLTMQPARGEGQPSELPFRFRLEGSQLVPLAWDKDVYGAQGVPLHKLVTPAPPARRADSTAGAKR